MKNRYTLILAVLFFGFSQILSGQKDCSSLPSGLIPLTDFSPGILYRGYTGGLFGNDLNLKTGKHREDAITFSKNIVPRSANGLPDVHGLIGFIGIGASNPRTEFNAFVDMAKQNIRLNSKLVFANTCIGGQGIQKMKNIEDNYWKSALKVLDSLKLSQEQVQVAWIETDNTAQGDTSFPNAPMNLAAEYQQLLVTVKHYFPNIKICYLAARGYSGFAMPIPGGVGKGLLHPRDYLNGWAVRFVVEQLIQQKPGYEYEGAQATIPFTTWGNYSWNDGNLARKDGFYLDCNTDIGSDGLHLTALGEQKIGNLMYTFFSTDESCVPWFFNTTTETTETNKSGNQSILFSNLIPMGNQELSINPRVEIIDILIFDAQGKLMSSNFQEKLKSISISTFNKGIYLIQAKTKEGLVPRSEKFVIY